MSSDFCAFILTHGRPDRVHTFDTLKRCGYTGKIFIVIDDEDRSGDEYRKRFGDIVLTFSKAEMARRFDEGDNFNDRRAIFYARNACFDLARQVDCAYFVQLDDDYTGFYLRYNSQRKYGSSREQRSLDKTFSCVLRYYQETPSITSIALSQGGDWIGGKQDTIRLKRKAMNSFFCSTRRPFQFVGRINEDVNTYTSAQRSGSLFLTVMQAQVNQLETQSNKGGMTEMYLDSGTYVKSFYSVMYAPSCVKIGELFDPRASRSAYRVHHRINWDNAAPLILRQELARRHRPKGEA